MANKIWQPTRHSVVDGVGVVVFDNVPHMVSWYRTLPANSRVYDCGVHHYIKEHCTGDVRRGFVTYPQLVRALEGIFSELTDVPVLVVVLDDVLSYTYELAQAPGEWKKLVDVVRRIERRFRCDVVLTWWKDYLEKLPSHLRHI